MKRRSWSTRDRTALFAKYAGRCHICDGKIDGVREAWDVSHEIPLALGGADDDENAKPAHRKCHRAVTAATDLPTIAKVRRVEAKHRGAKAPPRSRIQSRGFDKAPPQRTASRPLHRKADHHA